MFSADDAAALCGLLESNSVRFWVMGSWGVDALCHRETRPHKDLDLLVTLDNLSTLWSLFDTQGFTLQYVWQENRWLGDEPTRWPTAFVVADAIGRELDTHVIAIEPDDAIVQYYDKPWPLSAAISELRGQGSIAGAVVPCVSKQAQIAMHTGYPLPESHLRDLERLQTD